jgi:hypothetical protein
VLIRWPHRKRLGHTRENNNELDLTDVFMMKYMECTGLRQEIIIHKKPMNYGH